MGEPEHWTDPGAYVVAEGVYRIPLPLPLDGLRAVNVYAIETDSGLVLVDGGWAIEESRAALETSLASIDYKISDISRFLVTHMHRDHYTQAVALRREFGSHVSLGIGEQATLDVINDDGPYRDPNVAQLHKAGADALGEAWTEAMGTDHRPSAEYLERPDEWITGDVTLEVGSRQIDAVSTPGHTQGHYVFADPFAGLLFAGDHVLPTITPSIGFEPAIAAQPLRDFLGSLAKVRAMPDLVLLPAHGPVAPSVHARVDELVAHHDERLHLCRQAVEAGLETAYAVAHELPWTRHARALRDLDVFNSTLATMETLHHLELLAAQGHIAREVVDGTMYYRAMSVSPE